MKFKVDDLVNKGLVSCKTYKEKGLKLFKYKNNVFWDNLWHLDDRLLECRGIVTDFEDNVVIHPFTKLFNYKIEYKKVIDPKELCIYVKKMNGFMASAVHKDGEDSKIDLIVSTTGSLDSSFMQLARQKIILTCQIGGTTLKRNYTYIFEICDPEKDPHIVYESGGVYLIGMRDLHTNRMLTEYELDQEAEFVGFQRPEWKVNEFSNIEKELRACKHEGYIIRDLITHEHLFKMKSPFYLSKKFLMRMPLSKVILMYQDKNTIKRCIDEEFYDIIDHIVHHIPYETWIKFTDQQRRTWIEEFFKREY